MLSKEQMKSIKKSVSGEGGRMPIIFNALGDPGRFRIFKILMQRHTICVTEIASILNSTISAASQQLRVLERVGLIKKERMGRMICYELRDGDPLVQSLRKLIA